MSGLRLKNKEKNYYYWKFIFAHFGILSDEVFKRWLCKNNVLGRLYCYSAHDLISGPSFLLPQLRYRMRIFLSYLTQRETEGRNAGVPQKVLRGKVKETIREETD